MAITFEEANILSVVIKTYILEENNEGLTFEIEAVDSLKYPLSDFTDKVLDINEEH